MANELLKKADFEAIADSIAKQYQIMLASVGKNADTNTLSKGAANARDDVLSLTTSDSNLWLAADLGDAAEHFVAMAKMGSYFMQPAADLLRAIERHAAKRNAALTDINKYLTHIGSMVHPYLRVIYPGITAGNTWPLTKDTTVGTLDAGAETPDMGVYAITGAGVGALGSQNAIDLTKYGDALVKLVVTSTTIGAGSNLVVTVTGKDRLGAVVQGTATVTAGAAQNTAFNITSVRFAEITSVSHTNGSNGDQLTIRPRDDRSPAL